MRVLHLIDVHSPWGGPCTQRLAAQAITRLQRAGWADHEVLLIGRRSDALDAASCGLNVRGTIWPLRGRSLSAAGPLSRWLAACAANDAGPSVIHGWSSSAGALAAVAAAALPRVVTPRPLALDGDGSCLTPREIIRDRWQREEGIDPDVFVLGLLGEPAERFDARAAMHVGVRTGLSDRRIRMITSGRAMGRADAERFLARLDLAHVIVQDDRVRRPWEILRGLDAALTLVPGVSHGWSSTSLSSLPTLWAQAAGVPIIAEAGAPLDGLVRHGETGLLFPAGDWNLGCHHLACLHDDRALSDRLAAAAKKAAEGRFSIEEFCARLDAAYRRAIDERGAAYLNVEAVG